MNKNSGKSDIVLEAEKIVSEYEKRFFYNDSSKKKLSKLPLYVFASVIIAAGTIITMIIK